MVSSIRQFWQGLKKSVHPDDQAIFDANDNSFNLEYPPPAFIGDVDNAPVMVLMLNGGYDPIKTPLEFPQEADHEEYRQWLAGTRLEFPRHLSSYYTPIGSAWYSWVREGKVVIVNAVAYRSPSLSSDACNLEIAEKLPSVHLHRAWLQNEVLPQAAQEKRLVIAHRWKMWRIFPNDPPRRNVHFCRNPQSPHLSKDMRALIDDWLHRQND